MTNTSTRRAWQPHEDAYLRKNIDTHSYAVLGMALGRSEKSIKQHCHLAGIKRTVDLRKAATVNHHRAGAQPNKPKRAARAPGGNCMPVFDPSNPEHRAARRANERALTAAGPATNSTQRGQPYDTPELKPFTGRPGAMDAFALPSRRGGARYYRDGRVEVVA